VRGASFNSSILISYEPGAFLFLNCVRADNNSYEVIGSIFSSFDAIGNKCSVQFLIISTGIALEIKTLKCLSTASVGCSFILILMRQFCKFTYILLSA
jgi:hypothetical protein